MEVFIVVDYRQDKETGEEQFECPKVYATKELAQDVFGDLTVEILENISPREPIISLTNDPDYFILNTDWRYICIYYKKVEVIE